MREALGAPLRRASVFDDEWMRERELLDPEVEVEELLAEIAGTAPQRLHGPPRARASAAGAVRQAGASSVAT